MLLLTPKSAFNYLIYNENPSINIGYDALSEGKLIIEESLIETRNSILKIHSTTEKEIKILKQAKSLEQTYISSLKNESNFHTLCQTLKYNNRCGFLEYDPDNNIIIYQNDSAFITLDANSLVTEASIAKSIAKNLFDTHQKFKGEDSKTKYLPQFKPTILNPSDRERILENLDNTEEWFARILSDKIKQWNKTFDELSDYWDTASKTVIHRDLRHQNFLYNQKETILIDWELAAVGIEIYDLSDFCYYTIRYGCSLGNSEFDPHILDINTLYAIADNVIQEYYNLQNTMDENKFYQKILHFFMIKLISNYIIGTTNNIWETNQRVIEQQRIIYFEDLFFRENSLKPDFFKNYITSLKTKPPCSKVS